MMGEIAFLSLPQARDPEILFTVNIVEIRESIPGKPLINKLAKTRYICHCFFKMPDSCAGM
jgi:hypothetical protein